MNKKNDSLPINSLSNQPLYWNDKSKYSDLKYNHQKDCEDDDYSSKDKFERRWKNDMDIQHMYDSEGKVINQIELKG